MVTAPEPGDWNALSRLVNRLIVYLFGWLPDRDVFLRFGRRIVRVLVVVTVVGFAGGAFTLIKHKDVFRWLLAPADGRLSPFDGAPVFTAPTDPLATTLNVGVLGGFVTAAPFAVFGLYYIFRPTLPPKYQRFLLVFLPTSIVLFIAGAAFAYYILLEVSLRFLLNFADGVAVALITLPQYIELILKLMFWLGVIFQIPLVMYLLSRMHILSYRKMKSLSVYATIAMMIFAGIITPTSDPWTWAFVAGPMLLLYQVGLFLAWAAHPSEGDYLWMRSLGRLVRWILSRPKAVIRKVFRRV